MAPYADRQPKHGFSTLDVTAFGRAEFFSLVRQKMSGKKFRTSYVDALKPSYQAAPTR